MSIDSVVKVHMHIDSMRNQDLEVLKEFVRIPSIANRGNSEGVEQCAVKLKEYFDKLGFDVCKIIPTATQPMVYASLNARDPNAKTILFYGHYDVQPVEPLDQWETPPFEPIVKDGRIYGRGTADNKGQFLAHIFAIRSYLKEHGEIPVNIKFVLDGEEEAGSPSMEQFVRDNLSILSGTDVVYFADGPSEYNGATTIVHGFRGMFAFEIFLRTAAHANHSGRAGGQIPNAAIEISRLISSMIDENNRITVEGIYDDVLEPTDFEMALIDAMPFDPEGLARSYGIKIMDLTKEQFYMQQMFLPTFTINGVRSGYLGKGRKTAVPETAIVKIDMRLVSNMNPDDVERKIRNHINKHCPKAEIKVFAKTMPSKTSAALPISKAVLECVSKHFPGSYAIPSSGATCPDHVWTHILGVPSLSVPYGNYDQRNHAANENLSLECFYRGIHCSADVIDAISKL